MSRRVTPGESSASPPATARTARNSSTGSVSFTRKPLAPARIASKTYSSISNVQPLRVGGTAAERERQDDVLDRRERGDEVVRLEHEPDALPPQDRELAIVEVGEVLPGDRHPAARHRVEARHAVQQRRLPGARRAHDRGEAFARDRERETVERAHLRVTLSVDLRDLFGSGRDAAVTMLVLVIGTSCVP